MRVAILAAALVCAGTAQAKAAVFSDVVFLNGVLGSDQGPSFKAFKPFDQSLGTVTGIQFQVNANVNPGVFNTGLSVGSSITLLPTIGLTVLGPFYKTVVGAPIVAPVISTGRAQTPASDIFSFVFDLPLTSLYLGSFLSDPELGIGAYSPIQTVTTTDRTVVLTSAIDLTTASGAAVFNVTYTPVPEPVSLSLLGVGLLGAVVGRRKAITA